MTDYKHDEELARSLAETYYPSVTPEAGEPEYPKSALRRYMQGAFISGWSAHRTVQGEPSDDGHDGWCGCEKCEPTDAGVADMIAWLLREQTNDLSPMGYDYTDAEIAAALRAAYATKEGGR